MEQLLIPQLFRIIFDALLIFRRYLHAFLPIFGAIIISLHLFPRHVEAQIIPIDDLREEQLRIQQLFHGSEYSSFANRPVWNSIYDTYMNLASETQPVGMWTEKIPLSEYDLGYTFKAGVYMPSIQVVTNSVLPYGDNNEAAWYGRGLNTEFKGGVWVTSDYLTVTFRPQLVNQENSEFEVPRFIPGQETDIRYVYEGLRDIIDAPFRFGEESFSTISLGYTSVRAHYKSIEAGLSNEPLWWGANIKYPLLMSNNAPGMKHIFAGTRKPVRVPYVGKFEFKWIGAFPEDSDYFDLSEQYQKDRFMGGVNIIYSPAFAPNLHAGFARVVHTYIDDTGLTTGDFGMIFDPFYLKEFINTRGPLRDLKPRNHLNSIFGRWVWPESRVEIFAEFFRDDFAFDSRDLLMEPRHNSGYAFGMMKLIDAPFADFYKVHVEFTNMTPGYIQEVRPQNYYYTDDQISQGHTNKGQILGAAIGPGSNSQYVQIDGYFPQGRFGVFVRRLADNSHFHYQYDRSLDRPDEYRNGYGDYWRHRTDLTVGANGLYKFRQFIISGELSWTKLYNYGRFDYGEFGPGINIATHIPYDLTNLQAKISLSYTF